MTPVDPTTQLREMRPPADASPDEAALERILLAPPDAVLAPPRLRHTRAVALAGTLAVAVTAAVALSPGGDDGGGGVTILDRAAAAVSRPNTILHFQATFRVGDGPRRTIESWQTTDGRQERTVFNGSLESVRDQDARTFTTYNPERNELTSHTDPDWFREDGSGLAGVGRGNDLTAVTTIGDLRALLERARDGDDQVTVVGSTEIRGIPVEQVRITSTVSVVDAPPGADHSNPRALPKKQVVATRDVYLSKDDALPVRVIDRVAVAGLSDQTLDVVQAEQLPRTTANDALLRMSPHPGATRTDEGRFE